MKTYILTLLSVLIIHAGFAGNGEMPGDKESARLISGKVIDKTSGEEIAGAELKIADKTIYTDLNGNFLTTISSTATSATVSSISYNQATIAIDQFSYGEMVISLESN